MPYQMEYASNISVEDLRGWISAMIAENAFTGLLDARFTDSAFYATKDGTQDSRGYKTIITTRPQMGSIRIVVNNWIDKDIPCNAPFLAWDKIKDDIERAGYRIEDVTGKESTLLSQRQ